MTENIDMVSEVSKSVKEPVLEDLLPILIDVITEIGINKGELLNFMKEATEKIDKLYTDKIKVDELSEDQSSMKEQIKYLSDENNRLSQELKNLRDANSQEGQNNIISKLKELLIKFQDNWNSQRDAENQNFITKETFQSFVVATNLRFNTILKKQEKYRKPLPSKQKDV